MKEKQKKTLVQRKLLFTSLKQAKSDFAKIRSKCPSAKSIVTAKETEKKEAKKVIEIDKKLAEAREAKAKATKKEDIAKEAATIKKLREEKKTVKKTIKTASRTVSRWKSGGLSRGRRWGRKWNRTYRSGSWRSRRSNYKYGRASSYTKGSGCYSCQRTYDNYMKKCMAKTKSDNNSWKSCDAQYHQKTFGKTVLSQVEESTSLDTQSNSDVSLGHNDQSAVANLFGGNQDLNQSSTNSTMSMDSSNPSFYETQLQSKKSEAKLTADDYI